jgi:hypothetical protein
MMPSLISTYNCGPESHCGRRELARQLLEELRDAYQSLPSAKRGVVRAVVAQAGRAQIMQEMEKGCFESAL